MNRHTTTIHARCPFQPVWDYYTVTFSTESVVQCESLEAACEKVRGTTDTQESIGDSLRAMVQSDVSITVTGRHGANCFTEVVR